MSPFYPKFDILPPPQQRLWSSLAPATTLGMVLYGGTAIALRLGHRPSVDFDFFTDQPLDKARLADMLPFLRNGTVLQDEQNSWTLSVDTIPGQVPVKVSFFGGLGFGRVGVPEYTADSVLLVASLDDLMAHKTKVLLQRVEAKDYQDIAAMVRAGVSLERGLASARCLFGRSFQPSESLKAMVYFQGGDLHLLSERDKSTLVESAAAVRHLPDMALIADSLDFGDKADLALSYAHAVSWVGPGNEQGGIKFDWKDISPAEANHRLKLMCAPENYDACKAAILDAFARIDPVGFNAWNARGRMPQQERPTDAPSYRAMEP